MNTEVNNLKKNNIKGCTRMDRVKNTKYRRSLLGTAIGSDMTNDITNKIGTRCTCEMNSVKSESRNRY